jgi:hypothetical protein
MYILYSADGKTILGHHRTRADALRQEQAIEIAKHAGERGATKPRGK